MAKIVFDKCPPLGSYPNKSPPPGQKLGWKSPRMGANVWCKPPGVRAGGMVMDEIDTCIIATFSHVSLETEYNVVHVINFSVLRGSSSLSVLSPGFHCTTNARRHKNKAIIRLSSHPSR